MSREIPVEAKRPPGRQWRHAIEAWASALIGLGTAGYPDKMRRRLRSINVGCYTVSISCAFFALTYALEDTSLYSGAVIINLLMMAAAISVPAFHRLHELAGALYMAAVMLFGLFAIVAMVGRESGIQINFVAASALAFLIFELKRLKYIALVIVVGVALHILAWIFFREGLVPGEIDDAFLLRLYITTVVTIGIIVAVVVYYAFWTAEQAEAETEALLHRILPASVAERLKARPGELISDSFDGAAVLFSDLAGFVPVASALGAARTVEMLNRLVQRFDHLAAEHGVEKIKTIGDAYMAAAIGGSSAKDNATRLARMALRMQSAADTTAAEFDVGLNLRIGMALGPVMAGIIGSQRFGYDVWGDPVNLAARLESSGEAGRIQVSAAFHEALEGSFGFDSRGSIDIKGVGREETWFLVGETALIDPRHSAASGERKPHT